MATGGRLALPDLRITVILCDSFAFSFICRSSRALRLRLVLYLPLDSHLKLYISYKLAVVL